MQQNRERAQQLLHSMTIEEKVAQLVSAWLEIREDGSFSVREYGQKDQRAGDVCQEVLGKGVGQLTRPFGTMANDPRKQAKAINTLQHYLVTQTRLKIPAMLHEECLTGAMAKGATVFPSALNYGATWDPDLIGRAASTIGDELRSLGSIKGLLLYWMSPAMHAGDAWRRRSARIPICAASWASST
jgi:Beta-glucosidase-related glycosidases